MKELVKLHSYRQEVHPGQIQTRSIVRLSLTPELPTPSQESGSSAPRADTLREATDHFYEKNLSES